MSIKYLKGLKDIFEKSIKSIDKLIKIYEDIDKTDDEKTLDKLYEKKEEQEGAFLYQLLKLKNLGDKYDFGKG